MTNLQTVSPRLIERLPFKRLVLAAFLFASVPSVVNAQVLFGSIVGNVTDSSGASIPSATVAATQVETNETHEVKSNDSGGYTLTTIPAGTYMVVISKTGFRTFDATAVQVRLNTVVRVDAILSVGQITDKVEVTGTSSVLQTDRADVHGEFTTRDIVDLPQPTRSYQGVLALMPGIAPPTASGGGNNNPGKSMQISANGTSRSGTTVRIDGVTDTNPWVQLFSTYVPSMEAIETVNVATSSADAEQGTVNGAAINVQTKSGTNQLHGSLYEYNVNSYFKARPYFGLGATQKIPKFIENDLGGTLGGKIIRDKLFYFGSYEGDFISQAGSNVLSVPTEAIKKGDFTAVPGTLTIYDPRTGNADGTGRVPFANPRVVPSSLISPITQKLVDLLPSPNFGAPGALANNYYVTTPITNRLHRMDSKMDWNASSKVRVAGRFGYQPYNIIQGTALGPVLGGANSALQQGNVIATAVNATYIVSPNLVVDGNWGLTRANQTLAPPSVDKRLGSGFLGIPGTNLGDLPLAGGMPNFNGIGFTSLGYAYPYLHYLDPIYQYTANATWIKRSHNVRFGFDISRQHMNHQEVQPTSFTFNGGSTASNGVYSPTSNNNFADFLIGLPFSYQNSVQTTPQITLRTWQHSLYVRDQWQVNRKLTMSLGLRWELYPVPTRADRGIESFDLVNYTIQVCGVGGNPGDCGIQTSKKLFSPRIGFAYRPIDSLVVRGGFSLNPEQINMYRDGIYSYPARFDYAATGSNSFTSVGTLANGIPVQPSVNLSSGNLTIPPGLNFGFQGAVLPKDFVRGYTESWNFTVQKELGLGLTGQVAYVGTQTIHQHTRYNINYGQVGGGAASQPFAKIGITGNLAQILPYETMNYHSFQASLQRRFANGFNLQASYTRSKWIGLCCDDSGDGSPAIPIPQFANLNKALMNSDRPDNFRLSSVYELPFGNGKSMLNHGAAAFLAGGWQLNGVLSLYSGSPFSVSASGASLNAPGSAQRADQVKQNVAIYGDPGQYFDTSAFVPVPANAVRFGTAGFNTLRGPGVANMDLSLFRSFKITERWNAQFRAEALNLTNTPHFANPAANASNAGYGTITAVSAPSRLMDERFFRFGLKLRF